ncbi:L,D-transpeptidase family protein [Streptomyces sp. NPDC005438]|uniref:L,D-transpeptidase family protein n=1 Tax=Streptomyces sp. NPDC005438 TaxID=3156880 RepID=UPI0033A143B9
MANMRKRPISRWTVPVAALALALPLSGCGSGNSDDADSPQAKKAPHAGRSADAEKGGLPGVGERLQRKVPERSRQVLAVYGAGRDSAKAQVRLYVKRGDQWKETRHWSGHNGKRGWTFHHRENDKRSPIGVYTVSDAGGLKPDPGAKLPYRQSVSFTPPSYWGKSKRNDFDHVIAIDYNRVRGTSPLDPTRPQGQSKGGSIWLHLDHGSGTSGCVSISRSGMRELLRTLDPDQHPVVVMGDRAALRA